MGLEIKTGQGQIKPAEELSTPEWVPVDKKEFLTQRDYLLLYTIFKEIPESHTRVTENVRLDFMKNYESARNNRYFFTGASNLFLYAGLGLQMASRNISIKKGLLSMVVGTVLTNAANVIVFEKIYNKEYLNGMNTIAKDHYDILQDPQYMSVKANLSKDENIQQILNDHQLAINIAEQYPDKEQQLMKVQEIKQQRQEAQKQQQ